MYFLIACGLLLSDPAKLMHFLKLEIVLGNSYHSETNIFIKKTKSFFLVLDHTCRNKSCAVFCNFLFLDKLHLIVILLLRRIFRHYHQDCSFISIACPALGRSLTLISYWFLGSSTACWYERKIRIQMSCEYWPCFLN